MKLYREFEINLLNYKEKSLENKGDKMIDKLY